MVKFGAAPWYGVEVRPGGSREENELQRCFFPAVSSHWRARYQSGNWVGHISEGLTKLTLQCKVAMDLDFLKWELFFVRSST